METNYHLKHLLFIKLLTLWVSIAFLTELLAKIYYANKSDSVRDYQKLKWGKARVKDM